MKGLSSLEIFDLRDNFYKDFPIGLPHTLQVLQFSNNKLVGTLPKEAFTNLVMLQTLDVSSCNLTGDIPNTIKFLTSYKL
jgi:Leucine-rich repeat (LRR) protein